MPRKKNNRKKIQAAKRATQPKQKKAIVGYIAHHGYNHGAAVATAMLMQGLSATRSLANEFEKQKKDDPYE